MDNHECCDACGEVLNEENFTEGDLGQYCSDGCLEESEWDEPSF